MNIETSKIAWLAGIIDGEGSVGMYRSKTIQFVRNGKKYESTHVVYQCEICNNNELIIKEVLDIVNIILADRPSTVIQVVHDKRPSRVNSRVNYRVNIKDHTGLIILLSVVEPYLIGKKSQVQVMLNLLKTHQRRAIYTKAELEIVDILKGMKKHNTTPQTGNTEPSRSEKPLQACVETIQAQLL